MNNIKLYKSGWTTEWGFCLRNQRNNINEARTLHFLKYQGSIRSTKPKTVAYSNLNPPTLFSISGIQRHNVNTIFTNRVVQVQSGGNNILCDNLIRPSDWRSALKVKILLTFWMANMVKIASTAPAAPSKCPMAPFVEDTATLSIHSAKTTLIARSSAVSPKPHSVDLVLILRFKRNHTQVGTRRMCVDIIHIYCS